MREPAESCFAAFTRGAAPWLGGFTILACPLIVFAHWLAVAPAGTLFLLELIPIPVVLPLLPAFGWLVAGPIVAWVDKIHRKKAAACWIISLVYVVSVLFSLHLGYKIRHRAFEELAIRSQHLVDAIHRFESERGSPPESLVELVPNYLPGIPATGIGAYPDYHYDAADYARRQGAGDWLLWVPTSSGGINFDRFVYFPSETYPERGESGAYEPIGKWAYYHE